MKLRSTSTCAWDHDCQAGKYATATYCTRNHRIYFNHSMATKPCFRTTAQKTEITQTKPSLDDSKLGSSNVQSIHIRG